MGLRATPGGEDEPGLPESGRPRISPYRLDDDLIGATRLDGRPHVRIYRPAETAVVIGPGCKLEAELHLDACAADRIPVLQRRGGGCGVVLDPGNLVVSAALPAEGVGGIRRHFARMANWLVAGLERVGVEGVYSDGTSDLVLDNRKVGGSCIYRARGLVFYSSTLLINPDIDKVERCLKHPPREPGYRAGRPHREFMGAVCLPGGSPDIDSLADALRLALDPAAL